MIEKSLPRYWHSLARRGDFSHPMELISDVGLSVQIFGLSSLLILSMSVASVLYLRRVVSEQSCWVLLYKIVLKSIEYILESVL